MSEIIELTNQSTINPLVSIELFSNITLALIILLAGFAIGKLAGIAVFKLLKGLDFDLNIKKIKIKKITTSKNISTLTSWTIYTLSVIFALISLNILNTTLIIILYFIGILFIGTIILGIIHSTPNILAGIKIKKQNIIKENDEIQINQIKGKVTKIGITNTKIKGDKDEIFFIPNKIIQRQQKIKRTK